MSERHSGHVHHEHHHAREGHHEQTAQEAAHETALRLLADSRQLHVPAGGGPFQAIKHELPNSGDQGPRALAHMINQETGKSSYKTGEALPIPQAAIENTAKPPAKHESHRTDANLNPYGPEVTHRLNNMLNDLLRRNGLKPV